MSGIPIAIKQKSIMLVMTVSVYSSVIWIYLDTQYSCPNGTVLVGANGYSYNVSGNIFVCLVELPQ